MGILKSRTDIQTFTQAAHIAGLVCDALMDAALPGVTTMELESLANRLLQQQRSSAPFKLFEGFNHACCISINDEIVNGLPARDRALQEGDVISIAVGSCYRDYYGKAARTRYLGAHCPSDIQQLIEGTDRAIAAVIAASKTTTSLKQMLQAIVDTAHAFNLQIIDRSAGCGIGKQLHDAPATYNHPDWLDEDVEVIPGMAFTLMPMMTLGPTGQWTLHADGWTQVTQDGATAAHIADSCLMTETGLINLSRIPSA